MSDQKRRYPTSAESMKVMLVGLLEQSLDSMERIRDREWALGEIARIRNPKSIEGQTRNIKPTGIVRQSDQLGRIVLPMELRKTIGIKKKQALEIYTEGTWIIIEKANEVKSCNACGSAKDLNPFKAALLCESCIGELFDTVADGG